MLSSSESNSVSINIEMGVVFLDEDVPKNYGRTDARGELAFHKARNTSLSSKDLEIKNVCFRSESVLCSVNGK